MPHEEIDGVPIWYEEHGDPAGPPLVALHGGILTFQRSFGDVLPWLTDGRRVIGVELQGHGHTPDTGRAMSIERFADHAAEMLDLFPDCRLAVLPATRHSEVMRRTDELRALLRPFLS